MLSFERDPGCGINRSTIVIHTSKRPSDRRAEGLDLERASEKPFERLGAAFVTAMTHELNRPSRYLAYAELGSRATLDDTRARLQRFRLSNRVGTAAASG